jgi:hypothetical protein
VPATTMTKAVLGRNGGVHNCATTRGVRTAVHGFDLETRRGRAVVPHGTRTTIVASSTSWSQRRRPQTPGHPRPCALHGLRRSSRPDRT